MDTTNTRLLDDTNNREYYSKSDGDYIPKQYATKAHLVLDRVAWARRWVNQLNSQFHLDVGCKDGYIALTLAAEGLDCIGIDPSKDAIEEAQLRAGELDLDVSFINTFIEDYDPKYKFDTVTMLEVLEHVVDVDLVLKKLCELGRYVLISTPDANGRHGMIDSEQNEEHVRLYTQEELNVLVHQYGQILESVVRDDQLCIVFKPNYIEEQ